MKTVSLIYEGTLPCGSVVVGGRDILFEKGEPVEIPEKTAEQFLSEPKPEWRKATPEDVKAAKARAEATAKAAKAKAPEKKGEV